MYSTPESPIVKHCEQCGAVLPPKRKRFCSKTCNSAWRSAHYRFDTAFVCEHCGVTFNPKASNRTRFCSRDCSYAHLKLHGRPERRKPRAPSEPWPTCEICGKPASIRTAKTCSDECHAEYKRRYSRVLSASKKAIKPRPCKECGTVFTPEYGDQRRAFCSSECMRKQQRRIGKATRKARMRKAARTEAVDWLAVFNRDGWRCKLCGCRTPKRLRGTTDDRAPELDHIVPLAHGGEHSYANTQCLCRKCNQEKGASVAGQLPLV